MNNEIKVSIKAKTVNVMLARNIAASFLIPLNPTISFLNEIKTIVSEAVTNAIIHGYQKDETKDVLMNLSYDDDNIYIEVIDYGLGIVDIDEARMPMFTTKPSDERSGLGFTIMEVFADTLVVKSTLGEKTEVFITKKWVKEEAVAV